MIEIYTSSVIKLLLLVLFVSAGFSKLSKRNYYASVLIEFSSIFTKIKFKSLSKIVLLLGILECLAPIVLLFYIQVNVILVLLLIVYTIYLSVSNKENCECGGVMEVIHIAKPLLIVRNCLLLAASIALFYLNSINTLSFNIILLELALTITFTTYALINVKQITSSYERAEEKL